MGTAPQDNGQRIEPLLVQIAECVKPPEKTTFGIEDSHFVRDMNTLHMRHEKQKTIWERDRPRALSFAKHVFEILGVEYQSGQLDEYLDAEATHFAAKVRGLSADEQDRIIGSTVPRDSSFHKAFDELEVAVSDFHGNVYDGELHYARRLGSFVIEGAIRTLDKDIAS